MCRRLPAVTQNLARKLDRPEVVWALLDALRVGKTLEESLRQAGVSSSTFYRERRRSELFRGLVEQAETDGRARRTADLPPRATAMPAGGTPAANRAPLVGLLQGGSTDAASTTVVVDVPSLATDAGSSAGDNVPAVRGQLPKWSARSFFTGLKERLTRASRIEAGERRAVAQVPSADAGSLGIHWLPPQIALLLQVAVAVVLAGSLPLPLGIAALAAVYLAAALKLRGIAFHRAPAPRAVAAALDVSPQSPVDATHDLKWLDATLAQRPPAGRDK